MRIALVVPGRFHAFELALALRARGHEVVIFTNYPKWAARRFGVPAEALRSFWLHGALFRLAWFAHQRWGAPFPEAFLNCLFGRWAARALARARWDVIHSWSAFSQEILEAFQDSSVPIYLMRGSAHIRLQSRLLEEEERRTGERLDKPSVWVIAREEREYALAPHIIVLSSFAEKSFLDAGVPAEKLHRVEIAAPVAQFRPTLTVLEERCERLLSGAPLQVLYVGALSYQKGLHDLAAVMQSLPARSFHFRLVGPAYSEVKTLVARLRGRVELIGRCPERELPRWYAAADVFVFPTLQDGYALVLAQAAASALPIIATENSAAPDLAPRVPALWSVPIRRPDLIAKRLRWCNQERAQLVEKIRRGYDSTCQRTWADVAVDFEQLINEQSPRSSGKIAKTG